MACARDNSSGSEARSTNGSHCCSWPYATLHLCLRRFQAKALVQWCPHTRIRQLEMAGGEGTPTSQDDLIAELPKLSLYFHIVTTIYLGLLFDRPHDSNICCKTALIDTLIALLSFIPMTTSPLVSIFVRLHDHFYVCRLDNFCASSISKPIFTLNVQLQTMSWINK